MEHQHKEGSNNTDDPKTVQDIKHLHDKTQEEWTDKATGYKETLDEALERIVNIEESIKNIKKQIIDLEPGHCLRQDEFLKIEKRNEQERQQIQQILINQAAFAEQMSKKKELDQTRNGKMDKIDDKEDKTLQRVVRLETKIETYTRLLDTINSVHDRVLLLEEKQATLYKTFEGFEIKTDTKKEQKKNDMLKWIVIIISIIGIISTAIFRWLGW